MLFGLIQPFGVSASDLKGWVNVMMDQNKIYFDAQAELEDDGRLIAALYDGNGTLIEKQLKNTRLGETISLDVHEDASYYKLMLWSAQNNLKPLKSSQTDSISNISVYGADYNKNAKLVSDFGIINTTEEFDKERQMIRAEFACILCRMLNIDDVANAFSKDSIYTDVESTHWAAGYINLLGESDIIDVSEEGKFSPNEPISFDNAISAIVRALGYEPVAEELGGYSKIAEDLMITRGVDREEFKAKDVVNLVANTLGAPMLLPYGYNPETSEDYFAADGKSGRQQSTLLTDMGIYKVSGVITNIGYGEMELTCKENSEELGIDMDDEVSFKTEDGSLVDYLYDLVDVYVKRNELRKYEVVSVVRNKNCKTLTLVSEDIISCSQGAVKYNFGGETKTIDIDIEYASLNFNNYADLDDIISTEDTAIELLDHTGDGIYDAVRGTKYHYYTVDEVDTDRKIIRAYGRMISLNYEDSAAIILCDDMGKKLTLEDFNENDPIAMVSDNTGSNPQKYYEYIKIIKLTSPSFKATVESVFTENGTEYAIIDGKTYANTSWENLEPGETYMFRLGFTGKIAFADVYEGGASQSGGMYSVKASETSLSATDYSKEYENNTKYLSDLGIMSDIVSPKTEISRADFAIILCKAMNLEEEATGYKDKNIFSDINSSHYAAGAINLLAEKGIMGALSGSNFCPDANMRYAHAMNSAVDALGYSIMAETKGTYPLGYVKTAKQLGVLNNIQSEYYFDAQMLVSFIKNILSICHMEEISDGEYAVMDGMGGMEYKTYLTERDIYTATGIVTGVTDETVTYEVYEDSEDCEFEYGSQYVFDINDYSALDLLYMCTDVCVKKTGTDKYQLMYITPNSIGSVVTVNPRDIYTITNRYIEYYPENSTKSIEINHNIDTNSIVYNMEKGKINLVDIHLIDDAKIVFIENTGDNSYDAAVVTTYKHGFVDSVDEQTQRITVDGTAIELRPESSNIILADEDGKKISISDFSEGGFVAIMSDSELPESYSSFLIIQDMSESKITGEVYSFWRHLGNKYVEINETEYRTTVELEAADRGVFYIGKTGAIERYIPDLTSEGIAYILGAYPDVWTAELITDKYGYFEAEVISDISSEFSDYLVSNRDAFGIADNDGNYLFENASEEGKINGARLISYKLNAKGELTEFAELETNGSSNFNESLYDTDAKTMAGIALDDSAKVFCLYDESVHDISYLRSSLMYSGCVFKNVNNKYSVVVITGEKAAAAEKGDLTKSETNFAVVQRVVTTRTPSGTAAITISYTCDEAEDTVLIDSTATMQGDIDYRDIGVGDVIAFIADKDGYATDYAVIATMDYDGLTLSEAGIDAVSDSDTKFVHGYIEYGGKNSLEITPNGDGRTEEVYIKYAYRYTFDDSFASKPRIIAGGFMERDDMDYYDEDIGYTSKIFARIVDGEATDIYGYYHLLANK